jgi:hypothetical protein
VTQAEAARVAAEPTAKGRKAQVFELMRVGEGDDLSAYQMTDGLDDIEGWTINGIPVEGGARAAVEIVVLSALHEVERREDRGGWSVQVFQGTRVAVYLERDKKTARVMKPSDVLEEPHLRQSVPARFLIELRKGDEA